MSTLVILPTFRRPGPLRWSLASVLRQSAVGEARVVIVNNGGEDREVDRTVAETLKQNDNGRWQLEVIHRRPPLDPVLSWFGALKDKGRDGDVAFVHGDDDVLCPASVEVRSRVLMRSSASVLITRGAGNIIFRDESATTACLDVEVPLRSASEATARRPRIGELATFDSTFIGNGTYLLGRPFWQAYDRAMAFLERQPVAPPNQRGMLPLVLAMVANEEGGLAVADIYSTLRGQAMEEIRRARWGVANWQVGVLLAGVLNLLEKGLLRDRRERLVWEARLRSDFASWYLPTLLDRKGRSDLRRIGRIRFGTFKQADWRSLLKGARRVAASVVGRRGRGIADWVVVDEPNALFYSEPGELSRNAARNQAMETSA